MRIPFTPRATSRGSRIATVAAAVLTAFALGASAASAGTAVTLPSPLANGGFDENGLAGWSAIGESGPCPWTAIRAQTTSSVCHAGYGFQEPAPVDGNSFASTDFDRPTADAPADATLSQRIKISAAADDVTLHWSDFISWDLVTYDARLPRVASVEIRNASSTKVLRTLSSQTLLPGTANLDTSSWTAHTADLSDFAGCNVTLVFQLSMPEVATGPATYSVDGVRIESSHATPRRASARQSPVHCR